MANAIGQFPPRGFPLSGMPAQFKLLVGGSLVSTTGLTMSFPFITLYLSTQLGIPMDRVGLLFMGNAVAGLLAQTLAGPLADQLGRKPVMASGLIAQSLVAVAFSQAHLFEQFLVLYMMNGFLGAVHMPAANAMVVDLVGPARRAEAFSIQRVAVNLGWVIGPSVGGLLAGRVSYSALFVATAVAEMLFAMLILFFVKETLPARGRGAVAFTWSGGYGRVLRDRRFLWFLLVSVSTHLVATQLTTTMPVFFKQDAGIPESGYGMLMAVNAGLVVLFQMPVTRLTQHRSRGLMLALGALLYAVGFGSLGWWTGYPLFVASMTILTLGEVIIAPVASALVADLSSPETRARYMAAYGLTWTLGFGLGPALGGMILEGFGSPSLWGAAFVVGCASALAYLPLRGIRSPAPQAER